ncbi:Autoinducer 2 sensor kinase/phosphatase LuxQ [Lacunisphaera limnophila]|uniref:histidine kinase n=1 Tax=Lacunisphaera limnophila TaxID=1838286 RepID=A0A1I7PHZ3_9BACT|nr:hybrid sensor histidine kinase/response regulator [Lacunisphaera limnophila]AOS43243.1 Autoinducer 2 sensor kinase/phosphatase LuxQ [Lacunisphaera limnophila]
MALAMGAVGFGLNGIHLPVFGETGIILGGLATLLATYCLGPWWGAATTALAFSHDWMNTGLPWGLLLYTLEAVVVGWLKHRRNWHPLTAALAFWSFLGVPLALRVLQPPGTLPFPNNWALIALYPCNSLLMALGALTLKQMSWLQPTSGQPSNRDADTPLQRVLLRRLGLIIALSTALLGLFLGRQLDLALRDLSATRLSGDGHEVARAVQDHLDRHQRVLTLLAATHEADTARAAPLDRVRLNYPGFLSLRETDASGRIVASSPASDAAPDPTHEPATLPALLGSVSRRAAPGDALVVTMRAPLPGPTGSPRGLIVGELVLDRLIEELALPAQLAHHTIVIVDRHQRVVASRGDLAWSPLEAVGPGRFTANERQPDGETFLFNLTRPQRLERYLGTRQAIPDFGWEVYLAEPVWKTQRLIARYYLAILCGAAAIAALAMLLARGLAAEITEPFLQLATTIRGLTNGHTDPAPPPVPQASRELTAIGRELQAVAIMFTRTNRRLVGAVAERDRTQAELRELLARLEEKVADRTRELDSARHAAVSANEAKSEFLASMSHELRTPLNVIVGMSELIAERHLGDLNERQSEGVRSIHESGRHLLELINDILDLSKIESGMLELNVQPMEIADLCTASLRFVQTSAHQKSITLESALTDCPPVILADERRLKQILVNLLANAVKFTPAGGRVGLRVAPQSGGHSLRFEIWDTGIGIAPENHERIFQPFQQIDSSLSRQYAGTGLGLALVRSMAQLQGGCVDVSSTLGSGSTFGVAIPLLLPPPEPATPALREASAAPMPAPRARLLIAEDNAANRAVYDAFFEDSDCEIIHAVTGVEALHLVRTHRPDLILMDINMPEMDGLEAIRRLRADSTTEHLPIIAVTAFAMSTDRVRCLEAGASAYLSKPIDLRELKRLVSRFTSSVRTNIPFEFVP